MPPKAAPINSGDVARQFLRWLWVKLLWFSPVLVIGWLVWSFFGRPPAEQRSVESMVDSYSAFVRPHAAPGRTPGAMDLDPWLRYFDRPSREFFEAQYQRMAVRRAGGNAQAASDRSDRALRLDAMAFAISLPPLDGRFTIASKTIVRDGEEVRLRLQTTAGAHEVRVVREGGAWRFADFMGMREVLVPGGGAEVR